MKIISKTSLELQYSNNNLAMQIRNKFGHQVEAFFVILTAIQFHFLFYCTRPLPNILALGLGNYLACLASLYS